MAKLNLSKKTKKHEDDAAKQEPQKEKIDPSLLIPLPIVDFYDLSLSPLLSAHQN